MIYSKSYVAICPGATIREVLEDRGIAQKEFAIRMGISEKHINELINGKVPLTMEMALKLHTVLSIPADFWLRLELNYQEKLLKIEEENRMDSEVRIVDFFPYDEMAKLGWVEKAKTRVDRVWNLREFFEITELSRMERLNIPGISRKLFETENKKSYILLTWIQRIRKEARNLQVEKFGLRKLKNAINQIRSLNIYELEEIRDEVSDILKQCGILLVLLPNFKGISSQAITFRDGEHIVLGLVTPKNDNFAFWNNLFMAFGYLLNGIYDTSEVNKMDETRSDNFTRDILLDIRKYFDFLQQMDFSLFSINQYAKLNNVHPHILLGFLKKDRIINAEYYKSLKAQL